MILVRRKRISPAHIMSASEMSAKVSLALTKYTVTAVCSDISSGWLTAISSIRLEKVCAAHFTCASGKREVCACGDDYIRNVTDDVITWSSPPLGTVSPSLGSNSSTTR